MDDRSAAHTKLVADAWQMLSRELDIYAMHVVQGKAIPPHGVHPIRFGLVDGAADLCSILGPDGRWFCLEAKTGKAVQSKEQKQFAANVRRLGGFYAVFHDLPEARAALDRARQGEKE